MSPRSLLRTLFAWTACASAVAAQQLPGTLVDVTANPQAPDYCGIDHLYTLVSPEYTQMGGASCADFDNDGWVDVFLPGNRNERSKLYRNNGDGTFTDVGILYGVADPAISSSSGVFGDYDNDGDLDLIVAAHPGPPGSPVAPLLRVFRNQGAAGGYHFTNVSDGAGLAFAPTVWSTTVGWQGGLALGDYDRDGFLDFAATWWWQGAQGTNMWRLFRSVPNPTPGDGADPAYSPRIFVDATIEAGLDFEYLGEPWQPMFMDVNRDGWPDLHVCVDFDLDYMFLNNGDGTFTDIAAPLALNGVPPEQRNEMGSALGDIDNDGDFDLHVTNLFEVDRLYRADTTPLGVSFVDVAIETGLNDSPWGWGTAFFDFDNDGDLDHAAVSGFKLPTALPWYNTFHINLYPQRMPDGVTVAWQNGAVQVPQFSKIFTAQGDAARGLTWLDYDNDGDVDLVVTRHQEVTAVYKNTLASPNRWLQLDLVEAGGSLNTVGARAWVKTHDRIQVREVIAGSSFLCQEPPRLHFGLGTGPGGEQPSLGSRAGGMAAHGSSAAASGAGAGSGGVTGIGPGQGPQLVNGPPWVVVRWLDGSYQVHAQPVPNTIVRIERDGVNDAGDMDGDGHLTLADQVLLLAAINDPEAFAAAHPTWPGLITGDIDGNGFLEMADHALWPLLPPH